MTFVIFGDTFTFPEGNAATNRVHTYAKGFIENGLSVHVICFASRYDNPGDGIMDGINYYHPFKQKIRNKYFIVRRWYNLQKYLKTLRLINNINKKEKIIAINSWTQLYSTQLFIYLVVKRVRTRLIGEHSEHPMRNHQGTIFRRILGEVKSYMDVKLCDGVFCISEYLIDFYKSRFVKMQRLFLVPSTVDTTRFQRSYEAPLDFQYILYCGGLTLNKDGVDILIRSFARIATLFPDINLVLIGKGDPVNNEVILKNIVDTLKISGRVFFLGQLSRNNVPAYMTNAKILALARPTSIVSDAGFPSKLTEYLACGKPVVVTSVGEIPVYLKDNENAFLSVPDSVDAFADKLEFVLENYTFAIEVSARGKELTKTIFNYGFQAKRMLAFINSIK